MTLPADYVMRQPDGDLWLLTDATHRPDMPSITVAELRVIHGAHARVPVEQVAAILRVKRILGGTIVEATRR
jgi:hypothetical protein